MDQLIFRFSSISVSDHQHHNHHRSRKNHHKDKVHNHHHHHHQKKDPWNKLDDVLVESVIMQLPTVDICRCRLVCKRWRRVILTSITVKFTSMQSFSRTTPWFFVKLDSAKSTSSSSFMVYDTEVSDWRRQPLHLDDHMGLSLKSKLTPVAASGELMCFSYFTNNNHSLVIMNPLTGFSRCVLVLDTSCGIQIGGITLQTTTTKTTPSYKVFAIFRSLTNLVLKVFSSCNKEDGWIELPLRPGITDGSTGTIISVRNWDSIKVQTLIGVTTPGNAGDILINYFDRISNRLIRLDTEKGTYLMSDKLTSSLKLDMVKCNGRILVVILRQNVNGSRIHLEIFELDMEIIVLKPNPIVSREFEFIKKTDNISCTDHGDYVMICLKKKSGSVHKVVMWNIKENKWKFFPMCVDRTGRKVFFTSAYSFMPDIQAKV